MNNEMRRERAMQLKRDAEALRDKAGKVSTPLTEANAMCAKAKELETRAEQIIADAAARADDIPRLANEDTARPEARGMNGYMPRVGELFQWSGVTFRRIEGELVERAIRDGERAEVLFPVCYVKAPNNPDLVGGRGLMDIAEAPNFIFEGDDACNDPVGHPLTCDCPFGPVANESSDFKGDGCTVQADERALNMGVAARRAGQKLSENPFGDPDSLDMLGKPVRSLALSWRAGWCDADRYLPSEDMEPK